MRHQKNFASYSNLIITAIALSLAFIPLSKTSYAATLLVDFVDPVNVSVTNIPPVPNVFSLGYEFQVDTPTTIGSLGTFDYKGDGFAQAQQIGLWSTDGTLLASTFVDNSDPLEGFWRFRDITPVNLIVGQSYRLASQGGEPFAWYTKGLTVNSQVTVIGDKWGLVGSTASTPLVFPTRSGGDFNQDGIIDDPLLTPDEGGGWFGANAKVEPVPITDLTFTAVQPCRIVDTRLAGGAIAPGGVRSYNVYGAVASQGGNPSDCPSPQGEPHAVALNVTAVPLGNGNIVAYPFGSPVPNASLVNYRADAQNIANAGTVKTCFNCTKDISVKSRVGTTHVVIDVLGYYYSSAPPPPPPPPPPPS
jgi:hypothetical protein